MNSRICEPLVVCDASPLILLAKLRRIDLLVAMADEIWIPEAVWREVTVNSGSHEEIQEIVKGLAGCVRKADPSLEMAFGLQVDPGEAAALALVARHPSACLLIDDRRGRAVAELNGWHCVGTLGWLIMAKRHGLVGEIGPLINRLLGEGAFIDPRVVSRALATAGEK
ncbi:putative nucleic acid-binding protein [Opitutaceae bacterium TAV1]|nr:putative nucleic acid-binding protein [Opitutaceae bacterium TAV1]